MGVEMFLLREGKRENLPVIGNYHLLSPGDESTKLFSVSDGKRNIRSSTTDPGVSWAKSIAVRQ